MKNEFVSYEIALALKELGFEENCFGIFYDKELSWDFDPHHQETYLKAPLKSQAFRWFREKYKLYVSLNKYKSPDISLPIIVFAHIYDETNDRCINVNEFSTYEEAELECLKKLIEIAQKDDNKNRDYKIKIT